METLKLTGSDFLIKTRNEIKDFALRNGLTEKTFQNTKGNFYKGDFYSSWKWLQPVVDLIESLNVKLELVMTSEIMDVYEHEDCKCMFKTDFRLFWSYMAVLSYIEYFTKEQIRLRAIELREQRDGEEGLRYIGG